MSSIPDTSFDGHPRTSVRELLFNGLHNLSKKSSKTETRADYYIDESARSGEVYVTPMTGYPPGSTVFQDIVSYLSGIADPKMPPIPKSKAISHITFTRHNTQEEARTAAARGGDKGPQTHSWPFGKPASTSQASSDSARSITIASSNPSIEIPNSPGRGEMANATSQRGLEDAFFGIGHGASIAESSLT